MVCLQKWFGDEGSANRQHDAERPALNPNGLCLQLQVMRQSRVRTYANELGTSASFPVCYSWFVSSLAFMGL